MQSGSELALSQPLPGYYLLADGDLLAISVVGQTPYPRSQNLDLLRSQDSLMSRHLIVPTFQDGAHDDGFRTAVEPGIIGQVGRAQSLVTFAVCTVAGHTVCVEAGLAAEHLHRVGGQIRQRTHVMGNIAGGFRINDTFPWSQSVSVRLGKLGAPLASEP